MTDNRGTCWQVTWQRRPKLQKQLLAHVIICFMDRCLRQDDCIGILHFILVLSHAGDKRPQRNQLKGTYRLIISSKSAGEWLQPSCQVLPPSLHIFMLLVSKPPYFIVLWKISCFPFFSLTQFRPTNQTV